MIGEAISLKLGGCGQSDVHELDFVEDPEGVVVEQLGQRKGEMVDMRIANGSVFFTYLVPTRGLLGFRNDFLTATRGTGVINTLFDSYRPYAGDMGKRSSGSLIATDAGLSNPFGLANSEERGTLFIGPNVEVYPGMIVGKHVRDTDLDVNVCKVKQLSNMRSSNADIAVRLTPFTEMSLDRAIEYIGPDEFVEVTPKNVRMRKKILDINLRRRTEKQLQPARG